MFFPPKSPVHISAAQSTAILRLITCRDNIKWLDMYSTLCLHISCIRNIIVVQKTFSEEAWWLSPWQDFEHLRAPQDHPGRHLPQPEHNVTMWQCDNTIRLSLMIGIKTYPSFKNWRGERLSIKSVSPPLSSSLPRASCTEVSSDQ